MTYYHVRITPLSDPDNDEVRLDLSFQELMERFVAPYRKGLPLTISGRSLSSQDIQRVRISKSEQDSNQLSEIIRYEDRSSSVIRVGGPPISWRVANRAEEVTDDFITGPPGRESESSSISSEEPRPSPDSREVFVVHGRNLVARDALFEFLRAIDLHPLEWSEVVQTTGKASPYIGEILYAAFSRSHAVVVLFTPDDEARLKSEFQRRNDPPHETQLTGQARPNVLFEAGMAMGRFPERTALVEIGRLRPFTDIDGLHAIRMDGSTQQRQVLAQRLRTAGCPVNLDGTAWHTAGRFEEALTPIVVETTESTSAAQQGASPGGNSELSEDAKELLTEATRDPRREILKLTTSGGLFFSTNHKDFGEMGDPRSEARWEGAVQDLLALGFLIEDPEHPGKLFKVTREGYAAIGNPESP